MGRHQNCIFDSKTNTARAQTLFSQGR